MEDPVMRGATLVGLVAVCAAMLLAGPAAAQDRPDLLEIPNTSIAVNRPDGVDYVAVQLTDTSLGGGSSANHRQSVRVSHEFPGVDSLVFRLYEPDKVTRSTSLYKAGQKNYLWTRILLPAPPSPYNTFSVYGVVTGCKGDVQAKTVTGGHQLKYKFGCTSATAVMDQLAVPAGLRPTITNLFGSKLAFGNTADLP
jgi:hypothetical protein